MLETINIAGEASYDAEGALLEGLRRLNFIYGANGAGKTTISRVLAAPANYAHCTLTWSNGRPLEPVVYNWDFVARNLIPRMPGIFTLGEEDAAVLTEIAECRTRCDQLEAEIASRRIQLEGSDGQSGKRGELAALRRVLEEDSWAIKTRHDEYFREAFTGVRNARAAFCDRLLQEFRDNTASLKDLTELKGRAETIFASQLQTLSFIALPSVQELFAFEQAPILSRKIVGKEDIDIAALIRKLGNSDWVRQGLEYVEESEGVCPFCQQSITDDLAAHVASYFDESYEQAVAEVRSLGHRYGEVSQQVIRVLRETISGPPAHLDYETLARLTDTFEANVALNVSVLAGKAKTPSVVAVLHPMQPSWQAIFDHIRAANERALSHNELIDNQVAERDTLTEEVWKFVVQEAGAALVRWNDGRRAIEGAINGLTQGLEQRGAELREKRLELQTLERDVTSVEPTVTAINGILTSFGFTNFRLVKSTIGDNLYSIVRADGADATTTLSEGERTFIAFLYFYHLIRGSVDASGVTTDRIVVFDDPVSSLDSDVLFIVSCLIKRVLEEARDGTGLVKQVFVLTHNIYFHKEVTFDPKRGDDCRHFETFWIVKKVNDRSTVLGFGHNPIKTSYELLWSEVKNANRSHMTIQNTLRRILESYFKILGNLDRDEIVKLFEGRDQQICSSLFSWVNDGSHGTHDELYVSTDGTLVERYLAVFKQIFERTNHSAHYRMMFGEEAATEPTALAENASTA